MEWLPIETAPKGHNEFFLICDKNSWDFDCSVAVVCNLGFGNYGQYLPDDANEHLPYIDGNPTHWMPLPKPPA